MSEEPPSKRQKTNQNEEAIYGNYRGYASKRRGAEGTDHRLKLVPKDWVINKRVLDIGCNTGSVTTELAQHFQPYRITGVDIDVELVELAKKHTRLCFSRQEPLKNIVAYAREPQARPQSNYFPLACPRMFGYLDPPPSDYLVRYEEAPKDATPKPGASKRREAQAMPIEVRLFPHNIRFEAADWVNNDIPGDSKGYDIVFALSVSKWIHLNQLDKGLMAFFAKVFECLRPNGRFVLEPQGWDSYKKPTRYFPALKENYEELKYRPDDFPRLLLEEIGFEQMQVLDATGDAGFERPVQVYTKKGGSWF